MKALIIDDEPLACKIIAAYLSKDFPEIEVSGIYNDGFQGAKAIGELHPDLIFLDVQMPKLSGFEMLELIDSPPSVIFTTAFDEYAFKAFENSAVDYLLKPISPDRFSKAVNKFLQADKVEKQPAGNTSLPVPEKGALHRIAIRDGSRIRVLKADEIQFIEADNDYVKIRLQDGVFAKKKTLTYYEKALPESLFIRVHRSYLLNINWVTKIEPFEKHSYVAVLKSGQRVPVSKAGHLRLREKLSL